MIVGLASLTYAIIEGPAHGWLSVEILRCSGSRWSRSSPWSRYELRRARAADRGPLLPSAPFSGASAIALCAFAAFGGFLFLTTLYLQDVRGLSPFDAGLYMLPMAGMMLIFAPPPVAWSARAGRVPASSAARR